MARQRKVDSPDASRVRTVVTITSRQKMAIFMKLIVAAKSQTWW